MAACLSTQSKANRTKSFIQPPRAPGIPSHGLRQRLGKGLAGTTRLVAEEATCVQAEPKASALPRKISDCPDIARMHTIGNRSTRRTRHGRTTGASLDREEIGG